ncbi:DUF3035 domain-containing protein [Roseovarius sp. E0-M6]|uniref:DUF3035 domain-containing protein n=1 Tax=Roseovarius sp. E0-M6 TaxID=3127118 RepID=UPI00300FFE9C
MMRKANIFIMLTAVAVTLTACGNRNGDVKLTRFQNSGEGPDEFTILPTKPLQSPDSYNNLPAPNPGGVNLVDQNPEAEGIEALGGNAAVLSRGVSANETGLINHVRREGVTPGIRQTLAKEDREVRRKHGRVNILRIGPVDDYTTAYKRQWLDADAERQRLQRRGIATPSAPPPE